MGKVLIVTGGSRGIGAATCRLAAERGYAVCVNYRANREAAEQVVADCRRTGAKAVAVQADVAVELDSSVCSRRWTVTWGGSPRW